MDMIATARRQMLAGQLDDARERLINSYAGLSAEEMVEPGVAGEWSVRDILAHIAGWDREVISVYNAMLRGERPAFLDIDMDGIEIFNQEQHAQAEGASLDEVLTELLAAREDMLAVLREVSNAALFAPAPGDEHSDLSIAACVGVSQNHDEEHAEMIETWRMGREQPQ